MFIAFRTDATHQIGTGHFMRCLSLAEELKTQGAQIRFISRNLLPHLIDLLSEKGIGYVPLSVDLSNESGDELTHTKWLGSSQVRDAQATTQALMDVLWDWIVVDHYALDVRWESAVRAFSKQIMVIDDLADRQHDCDVLLDQNFYADAQVRYSQRVPDHCQLLLGPRFAALRKEFMTLRKKVKLNSGEVKKLLIYFGGVDADNYTSLAIEALAEIKNVSHVDVVIGAQHPYLEKIQQECIKHGYVCHVQTTRMAELMAEAHLAIGAGGSSMWERCCLGLPSICISIAENQRKQIEDAAEAGLIYAPTIKHNLVAMIRQHTGLLMENPALLKLISKAAMQIVDGSGIKRVVSAMRLSRIDIRQVTERDLPYLFEWRNHSSIRAVSRNKELISREEHERWFTHVMTDRNCVLLICAIANKPACVVRFDNEENVAEVSIYLVPNSGFSGQGSHLLAVAEKWLKTNRPEIKSIRAVVLSDNEASKRLFLGSNYRVHATSYLKNL